MLQNTRWSTVYDLAGLRLHSDGTRVQAPTRKNRHALRDARGNWIATHAVGSWNVKKRRRSRPADEREGRSEGEDFDFRGIDGSSSVDGAEQRENLDRDTEASLKDHADDMVGGRSTARRIFKRQKNLEFLQETVTPPGSLPLDANNILSTREPSGSDPSVVRFEIPSSDLLKCIHHFASSYYGTRGQLFNGSKQYRKEKKERRLWRQRAVGDPTSSSPPQGSEHPSGTENLDSDGGGGGNDDGDESESNGSPPKKGSNIGRISTDMYKTMDGSALIAIGMLLQEYVASLLTPRIPDGWKEDMQEQEADENDAVQVTSLENGSESSDSSGSYDDEQG